MKERDLNSISIRVLFQCHNRRGLGHLMRGLNIAQEIRNLSPASEVLFYTKSDPASWNESFQLFVETDEEGESHWPEAVRSFSPNVIVYDTILPESGPENRPENRIDDGPLSSARRVYRSRSRLRLRAHRDRGNKRAGSIPSKRLGRMRKKS